MRARRRPLRIVALLALLLLACGDDGPGGNPSPCDEGYQKDGLACVPVFDDPDSCAAPHEMPRLGGGCRAVGVTRCATGFESDGEGGCEPILPAGECPPGTMERLGETECQPVGVTRCASGFIADGEGGCDAILPGTECPPGTLEVIGFDACQPLGDCGPDGSPWGRIATDGTTVYVDATADATGASGTAMAPFPTVAAALAAVSPGGQVAIAAGTYVETLVLDQPVRLEGRCAARVTLQGLEPGPTLSLPTAATGSAVRGVTLTGPDEGLQVTGARQVVVEAVEVRDTGSYGVALRDEAEVVLRQVKVTRGTTAGILTAGSDLRADQVVLQGSLPEPGTDGFGRGIRARCTAADRCGSVQVDRSLITGNRDVGINAWGVPATIRASVVRGTLSRASDQSWGVGIVSACDPALGVCGRLLLEQSLVTGNRRLGILASSAEATLRASVVSDTLADASDLTGGWGVAAQCDLEVGTCGPLLVEESLVAGNRGAGISAWGVDVTVRSSAVQGTRSQESDRTVGRGIEALCYGGHCGHLLVDGSLVTGNRDLGVLALGVEARVRSAVVRDTLARESDRWFGQGILAQADLDLGVSGSLVVEESLVTGNREAGIASFGAEVTIRASVVRDTRPREIDQATGRGILSTCHEDVCGHLRVEGSLVAGNRKAGVSSFGVDTTIRGTVVHGTLADASDLSGGRGINAQCDDLGVCGSLTVEESLVADNREMGIYLSGVSTTVRASVIRDTLPQESDQRFGRGIDAYCDPELAVCASLTMESSLVAGNREGGIVTFGVETTIRGSVVRDTWPREDDQGGGTGISVHYARDLEISGSLTVEETLVTRSGDAGIVVIGVPALLRGVAVVDTAVRADGQPVEEHGEGIFAQCDFEAPICYEFDLVYSRVTSSQAAGVAVLGVWGLMYGSVVETVASLPGDGSYGYGIQVGGWGSSDWQPTFTVDHCVLRDARLAGALFHLGSQGHLAWSEVSGAEYCVAMNEGTAPSLGDGNRLTCSVQSEPAWVNLYPAPAPPPATPALPVEQ